MASVVRGQRGVMGWVFLILFYGVNLYFAWALFRGLAAVSTHLNDPTANIGVALGLGSVLAMWAFAAVITGLLAMLTRGRATLVEDERPPMPEVDSDKLGQSKQSVSFDGGESNDS
jgi:hypothetical protein